MKFRTNIMGFYGLRQSFLFFKKGFVYSSMKTYMLFLHFLVSTLKDQLEDLKKVSQNSQLANEKLAQLQKQVSFWNEIFLIKINLCFG